MAKLADGVGLGQVNRLHDVMTVQALLNQCLHVLGRQRALKVDGRMGPATLEAIRGFQSKVLAARTPDGVIKPGGPTFRALVAHAAHATAPQPPKASTAPGGLPLEEYVAAARALGCEAAVIMAVVKTELGIRGAFDEKGRPTILFERHRFSALTDGKFDKAHPDIANKVPGGYGHFSEQYPKLERAIKLAPQAALKAASWGAFQIMGENHQAAGFATVDAFVAAMKASVSKQLLAFVAFVKANPALVKALRHKDWTHFAKGYNGPGYKANQYDTKMKNNYNTLVLKK